MQMGVIKCFDIRPRSAYGESVAPDGGDASFRSKRRDEPRYDYGLLLRARLQPSLKSGTAEAQSCLGPRRQGSGGITAPGNALSGIGRRAQAVATTMIAAAYCYCLSQFSAGMPTCVA